MKLITYRLAESRAGVADASFGVLTDEGIVDAGRQVGFASLKEVLAAGALPELAEAVSGRAPDLAITDVLLLPPIPDPEKIVCAGVNYRSHRDETARPATAHPMLFTRFADTQIGHGGKALKPAVSEKFDYEGELAVVIGETANAVSTNAAMRHVAGFACYNDFSARDWQRHTSQFIPGKNFVGTGAFGPCLVTKDEINDIGRAELRTRVNGDLRQHAPIRDLIFSIEELISYISTFTILHPGDVIVTGTPGGVGLFRDPPEFLRPGDHVEVEISGVGLLSNVVA